ncbi:MAG TPA: vancomycin resistance histidine kinase VanS [Ruminococcaceae bacterium]|nr:vancomycin resistance histidine kinase VanS [Oscillospiraceae bacterium]
MFIWQPDDPLYQILKFVKDYILVFLALPLIAGWAIITYRFMGRPLRYLDEVISASEKLAIPTNDPIILSDAMKSVQDELNQVRDTAFQNARLAKEAEQRKNDLIVYLAHDLKTPLTSVIGYLTLLRDEGQISEELREKYLSVSLTKAERLEELINEFFEITRFNLSNIELQYSRVNLTRLLEQLSFEFKGILSDKGLECILNAAPDVMIKCDVNKLQRVFDNLLRNAVFYSFENSVIEITVLQNNTETTVKFTNHGDNIPHEKLGRIFEQFYRLDTARGTNRGGAGLGLAIAKEIITLHHGTITASSENELIEFCVTLPLSWENRKDFRLKI